jgi:hypothetical protein
MRFAWLTIVVLLAAQPAFADIFDSGPSGPVDSYRLEVVAVDASAVAALAIGHNSNAVIGLSIATYALGAPILHIAHGRIGTGVASLFLRAGLPLLGGLAGYALTADMPDGNDLPGWAGGVAVGLIAGTIAASAIDVGVFAKGDEAPPRVAPAVAPTSQGGMTFGLAGRF